MVIIGVLGLQGAYVMHQHMLKACGINAPIVKTPEEILACDALVMPGGESTTMGLLMQRFHIGEAILSFAQQGKPIFGTCAGMILLAREIIGSDQYRLGLMDIAVHRNAFGRQIDSFSTPLNIPVLGEPDFPAIFIRAPVIEKTLSPHVEILCSFENKPILVRQGQFLVAAFHPELSHDLRIHQYFIQMINSRGKTS